MTTDLETNGMNHEEQGSSQPQNEDQASGCQAPGMFQGLDSELGLTVDKLSTALKLPADFLKGLGVSEKKQKGANVVTIPYLDQNRELVCTKQLQSLYGRSRFVGEPLRVVPYGLWRIHDIKRLGKVILVPSEKDCWVCWHSRVMVLGLPNTDNSSVTWLDHLRNLEVFLWDGNLKRDFLRLMDEHLPRLQVLTALDETSSLWQAYAQGKNLGALIGRQRKRLYRQAWYYRPGENHALRSYVRLPCLYSRQTILSC